jgi:hypothetical protein
MARQENETQAIFNSAAKDISQRSKVKCLKVRIYQSEIVQKCHYQLFLGAIIKQKTIWWLNLYNPTKIWGVT